MPGLLMLLALLALGRRLGGAIVIGLFLSLPFGSTALGTLSALGGSSPLIFVAFLCLLIASVALRRGFAGRLAYVLNRHGTASVVGALIVCAIASAVLLPRLFLGHTTALVQGPQGVSELPLAPTSSNITQTGYFVLGALAYFAFAVSLRDRRQVEMIRRGFLAWAVVLAGLGAIDLGGKMSGAGDLLAPIRTATYAYMVETEEAGFWRIVGGYSEASAFGSVTLSAAAFSFTYWRASRSRPVLLLTLVLFALMLLSTSSTAYAGFAIVASFTVVGMALAGLRGRWSSRDALPLVLLWLVAIVALLGYLADDQIFDPVVRLFDSVVLSKSASGSAEERLYWNTQSLRAFIDTYGLGVGLGSSRASSWPVAVLSQLGVVGALLMAALVGVLLRDLVLPPPQGVDRQTLALVSGVRAAALASLAGASVSSGFADPGLVFFVALAVVGASRGGELAAQGATATSRSRQVSCAAATAVPHLANGHHARTYQHRAGY